MPHGPRPRAGSALAIATLMVASCSDGGSEQEITVGGDVGSSTTVTVVTTSTAPPSTTAPPSSAPTTTSTTTVSSTAGSAVPAFPPDRDDLEHGGAAWGVVLAAGGAIDHPDLEAAVAAAEAAGYQTGPTDCDQGAALARGHADTSGIYTVSVYFDSRQLAEQAAHAFAAHGHPGGVVTEVRTYCLD